MNFAFVDRRDIEEYERGLKLYLEGKMPEARFTPFRLQMGIYGQRQEGVQMVRIKVPGGVLSADQLRVVGEICDRHAGRLGAPKLVHVTTRQDLQMHFVALEDTPTILRRLADAGLTTREACGNTVRNVTSCFLAGRCPAARADASVHARAFAQSAAQPEKLTLNLRGKCCASGWRRKCCANARACTEASARAAGQRPAKKQLVTLRTVLPQASRVVSPASASRRKIAGVSSSATKCICRSWRVVTCMSFGAPSLPAWRSQISPTTRS